MENNICINYFEDEKFKIIFHFKYEENNTEKRKEIEKEIKKFHKETLILHSEDLEIHVIESNVNRSRNKSSCSECGK